MRPSPGLPPQVGLATCFVPMLIYALIGTSRPLSVSTSSTLAILVAAELGSLASGGAPELLARTLTTLTLMVGVVLLLARLAGREQHALQRIGRVS